MKTAIRQMEDRLVKAFLASDWKAVADLYSGDAVLMPPNVDVVRGPEAIASWFAGPQLAISAFTTSSEAIEAEGGLATNRGAYTLTFTAPGMPGPVTDRGKYVWVLRRGPDGSWRIVVDMFSSNNPPA